MHSGLQVGGAPRNPDTQEQTGCSLICRQTLFGPHGVGEQGFLFTVSINITVSQIFRDIYSMINQLDVTNINYNVAN